jgi:glycosyltransferase involved in cell wall biosynthesis
VRPPLAGRRIVITADAVGGVWRYALDVAAGLVRRDVRAAVLGMGPEPSGAQLAEARAAGVALDWLDDRLDWTMRGPAEAEALARDLGRHPMLRAADILHLNAPALHGAGEAPRPTVVAAHSCLTTWSRGVRGAAPPAEWAWHRRLTARGLRRAAVAVAPSRAFAQDLVAAYGPLPALRVLPNGAVPVAPLPREDVVLAAGRWWDPAKNIETLDAAAARIDWPAQAAGSVSGPRGERVTARHLQLLGTLGAGEMAERLGRAPIHVSLALYEPFGLSVLEAASAGAALVLSDIPTFRELWEGAALFVGPRDAEDVARAVNGLIADPGLRRRLGADAARRASLYSLERQVGGLIEAYATALAPSPGQKVRS